MDIHITFALAIVKLPLQRNRQNMHAYVHNFPKDVAADIVPRRASHANAQKLMQSPIQENMSTNTAINMRVELTIIN